MQINIDTPSATIADNWIYLNIQQYYYEQTIYFFKLADAIAFWNLLCEFGNDAAFELALAQDGNGFSVVKSDNYLRKI